MALVPVFEETVIGLMPGMELRSFFFPISTYTLNTEANERAQDNELFFVPVGVLWSFRVYGG